MLMSPDRSRVEHDPFEVGDAIADLQCSEDTVPDTMLGPSPEATEDRIPVAEVFRQSAPGSPIAVDPEHSVDEEAVVASGDATVRGFAGQEVFDTSELLVGYSVLRHRVFERMSVMRSTLSIVHAT